MMQSIKKFFGYGVFLVAVGIAVLYGSEYVRYKNSPEYRATKDMEKLVKQYADDPYGGNTPEETLALFISALKQGDTDLAAKYFILDKQEKWKNDLLEIKERGFLEEMVRDLERAKKTREELEEVFYTLTNEENIVALQLIIGKGVYSQRWKIYEL